MKNITIVACFVIAALCLGVCGGAAYLFATIPVIPGEVTYYTQQTIYKVVTGGNEGIFNGLGLLIFLSLIGAIVATVVGAITASDLNMSS